MKTLLHRAKVMLRRIASAYIWFAPLLIMSPLWFVYHKLGLPAGIVGRPAETEPA